MKISQNPAMFLVPFYLFWSTSFSAAVDRRVNVSVVDAESGEALAARLYLTAESQVHYYFQSVDAKSSTVKYDKQNWLDNQAVEHHTTVSAHPCFAEVPSGNYSLTVERGKTYRPITQSFVVKDQDVELKISLQRWNDPAAAGWYS